MDGAVHTIKARLCGGGHITQTPGIDYEETFSPVADIRAIRILIAIAAVYLEQPMLNPTLDSASIEKSFKAVHMENSKRGSIPMQDKLRLSKSQGASTPAELKRMQSVPYASAVGSIMYAVRCTRPDVAFAQNITMRFQQNIEAEYIAAFDASKEAVWVRKFISGLGVVPTIEKPINMYCDNTGAIAIANESGITKGARHFRAKVHYLRRELLNLVT
ncbi:retrotransposon protein, putative, ty1-copia subclass [Tanacetum coccineum]